jgi:hypothetical protein
MHFVHTRQRDAVLYAEESKFSISHRNTFNAKTRKENISLDSLGNDTFKSKNRQQSEYEVISIMRSRKAGTSM